MGRSTRITRHPETQERQPSPSDLITQWETTRPQRQGWREHRTRESDARIVRVVDFERAMTHLTPEAQSILTYREHRDQRQVSDATGVSVRALSYKLPAARQALASILDRLDLP